MKAPDAITESFKAWVEENTPEGARLVIHHDSFPEIEVCCDGHVPYMAHVCALDPGHTGDCWSWHKKVNFKPEQGGPR